MENPIISDRLINLECVDSNFSTTRMLTRKMPTIERSSGEYKTMLFLPRDNKRICEGGLRTKGYFKRSCSGNPLVSVVTVVFNGEKYLEDTINSVINQTYDNVEYVIIDGGSTDGTIDIIKRYENKVDYWVSENDHGIYDAMNKGISLTTGDLIGLINADDYYHLKTINTISNCYQKSPKDIYFGNKRLINEQQRIQKIISVEVPTSELDVRLQSVHPTVFVSSNCYKKIRFNNNYKISADYAYFIELIRSGVSIGKINSVLATMREGGVSSAFHIDEVRVTFHKIGTSKALAVLLKTLKSRLMALTISLVSEKLTIKIRVKYRGWFKLREKCDYDSGEMH